MTSGSETLASEVGEKTGSRNGDQTQYSGSLVHLSDRHQGPDEDW